MAQAEYDRGQACLNGHGINGNALGQPEFSCKFCSQCGEPTITNCQNTACSAKIRGNLRGSYGRWNPPNYCHECGTPYPWTIRNAEALAEAIDELDQLGGEEREKLKQSIPDVLKETPKTETAAGRFRKAIGKVGTISGKMLSDVLVKVAAEVVVSQLGLKPPH